MAVVDEPLFAESLQQLQPRPKLRHLDWCRRHLYNERGKPYDHAAYPHLAAPGGPSDAFDDPDVRLLVMQFATRLGKTYFGQSAQCYTAAEDPCPMMFASSVEKLAKEVTKRTYRILERCRPLKDQLLPDSLRSQFRIELENCSIEIGWARSPSTLGDKNAKVGHASEIDKWERHTTSGEGDPVELFLDRGKDFPAYKFILESTPSRKDGSRIEARLKSSSYSRFHVPCPHCREYQWLDFHRLRWDRRSDGSQDSDIARRTARYECLHCGGRVEDHHRSSMMRLGVWAPAGCDIDSEVALRVAEERLVKLPDNGTYSNGRPGRFWKHAYILGEPDRDSTNAGFQLSSLYALSLTWGAIAAKWVESYLEPTALQNFINQWLAETFSPKKSEGDWQELATRLIVDVPRAVIPTWASMVTVGVDKQKDHYKFLVDAFGPHDRSHTLEYGRCNRIEWLLDNIILKRWPHEDGGDGVVPAYTLVDSGYAPKEPYDFMIRCLRNSPPIRVVVCKGSSRPLQAPFKVSTTGKDTLIPGLPLIMIDPEWTQLELSETLATTQPGAVGSASVYAASEMDHEDFLRQLLNDGQVIKIDRYGNETLVWNRLDPHFPNDYRDCKRYAHNALRLATQGRQPPARAGPDALPNVPAAKTRGRFSNPDGRAFVASQR